MVVMTPKRIIILILAALFGAFIAQNFEAVSVSFLFWKTQASQSLILLGVFFVGVILGLIAGRVTKRESTTLVSTGDKSQNS